MKNTTQLGFEQAKALLRGQLRGKVKVSFEFDNMYGKHEVIPSISTAVLYKDWWGDCHYCPSNETNITHIQFVMPGMTLNILGHVIFQDMMEFISKEMRGKKAPEAV